MKAIVLIRIETGEIQHALRDLKRIHGIDESHLTFGPYDAIAVIQAENLHKIGRLVEFEIQTIPGVIKTCTCLMVEEELPVPALEDETEAARTPPLAAASPEGMPKVDYRQPFGLN